MLKEGDLVPDIQLINFSTFKDKKLILYFYPKDNTPGCTAEACNLRDNYQQLKNMGFEVIGVSPDSEKSHQNFTEKYNLPFALIPDTNKELLNAFGSWGEKKMYGKSYEGVLRSTFVIENGKITKVFSKVETKTHTEQILKSLEK